MSYKFFQNKDCPYFPCHKKIKLENFNCLFCYCPLYYTRCFRKNVKFINNIKDCTNCTIPHLKQNYDKIIKYINEINKQISEI